MLSFVSTDTTGKERLFSGPLSLTIRMDEKVPADDLYAVFAYESDDELTDIRVYDSDRLLFVGVIDEQSHVINKKGVYLQISARSLAALLLDNEAEPRCYDHPSASLIYEHHVMPYGIRWDADDDAAYFGEQQINKGMSQWSVLKNFCTACYSSFPRISADGVLRMKESTGSQTVVFSDEGGAAYTQMAEHIRRCEEISRVNIKISDGEGYRYRVENDDAIRRGIRRERYLNAVLASTPMTCADAMLQGGEEASYVIELKCPGRLTDMMGRSAVVRNKLLGEKDNLYVSGVTYRMDKNGETTLLRLKRRKHGCGYQDM